MPIEKSTLTTLRHEGGTFVIIPSDTIAALETPEALAILVYLMDRPKDWIIRRDQICERFTISRERYAKAFRELLGKGLAWKEYQRNEQGHITHTTLCISATLIANTGKPENPTTGKHRQSVNTDGRETPSVGESGHLHNTDLLHNTDTDGPAEKTAGPRRLPEDWQPSEKVLQRAIALGYQFPNFPTVISEFKDYWINDGRRRKDWDGTFINRLKALNDQQTTRGTQYGKKRTPSELLANDLQASLAL